MGNRVNSLSIYFTILKGEYRCDLIEDVSDLDGEKLAITLAGGIDIFITYDQLKEFIIQLQNIENPNTGDVEEGR